MLQKMRWRDASISSLILFLVAFSVASLQSSLSVNLRNDTTVADNLNDIDNSSKNDRHRSAQGGDPQKTATSSSTVLTHLSTPRSYAPSPLATQQSHHLSNHSYPLTYDTAVPSHHDDPIDHLFDSTIFSHLQPSNAPQSEGGGDDYESPFPGDVGSPTTSAAMPLKGSANQSQEHSLKFLDKMFIGYDKRAWPTYSEKTPTEVEVNIYINSLGSVNAANMEYSMDIYLRQKWVDPRLALSRFNITESVTLNGEDIVQKIWKPDLFFRNVKQANFHTVTVPNKLIKLSPNGEILFSMRLTLRLSCHMSFRHYPLDTQSCDVVLGSYAQTVDQVVIEWQKVKPILIEFPLELPEFDVTSYSSSSFTRTIDTGSFSFLNATFTLVRQNGYHLIQTYMPTFLIVMISWVSFWLNVDATPARVTLGVTTLLTLTTVASGVRTQLPPVSYVKAIDVWIGACSVMVFGALLEFTLVNYLSRSKLRPEEIRKSINIFHWSKKVQLNHAMDDQMTTESELARNLKRARTVDRISRVMFPLLFFIFNAVYWPYYLYVPDRQ